MNKQALLVLEDGSVFRGQAFGAKKQAHGEVVFNTSMTGYQEMLTDPSYAGQIVMPTYPLIGNYGINQRDFESGKVQVSGFVVREHSLTPSHRFSEVTLDQFLIASNVPAISGIDTRAITRRLRIHGVMMGTFAIDESLDSALNRLRNVPPYNEIDFVGKVTTKTSYPWLENDRPIGRTENTVGPRIIVLDYGLKYNILRILKAKGCDVLVVPATTPAVDILGNNPSGVLLSPGPGDPQLLDYLVRTTEELLGKVPIMGICLGNQMLGRALGGKTFKLKFGHRGGNHPVQDVSTGRVHITSQNHGYAIDPDTLPSDVEVSHINLNDGTVEGLRHTSLPAMSIQYHSEASPGPLDNEYIFNQFLTMIYEAA